MSSSLLLYMLHNEHTKVARFSFYFPFAVCFLRAPFAKFSLQVGHWTITILLSAHFSIWLIRFLLLGNPFLQSVHSHSACKSSMCLFRSWLVTNPLSHMIYIGVSLFMVTFSLETIMMRAVGCCLCVEMMGRRHISMAR